MRMGSDIGGKTPEVATTVATRKMFDIALIAEAILTLPQLVWGALSNG